MSSISQANRGAPVAGLTGSTTQPAAPLGANQARPPSSTFEVLGHGSTKPPPVDEKALSKEQKEAFDRQKQISDALDKNDTGKLRDLAKDQKSMAAATPEQKAAVLNALCKDVNANGKGNREDRAGIVMVLQSAGSDAEYQALMQAANPDLVKEAMTLGTGGHGEGPGGIVGKVFDQVDEKLATQFDVIAGAHGCSPYAMNPENAAMSERALARGYTADQILAARQKSTGAMGDDDRVKGAAEDPLAMMVTTPKEKSAMLQELKDGWTTDSEDRAMVSILESCEDKAEFDKVIDGAGGRDVIDELDDDEAKKKANLLCGAYDRVDCATDPKLAVTAHGDLTDPARVHYFLNGADEGVVQPQAQPRSGDLADDYIRQSRADTAAKVATLDRRTVVDTVLTNSERQYNGKPMFDPRSVRQDVSAVMSDPSLKDGEKEKKIDELRKQAGLSEYTMRNIATQPLARIYENQTVQAARFAAVGDQLEQQRALQVAAQFGANSLQAQAAFRAAAAFRQEMAPYTESLQGAAKKLDDLFPPPKSFWEGALGFLGDLAKTVAPALLNLIPGVGTALFVGYEAAKTVWDAAHGNWLGALTDVAGVLPGLGTAGQIASAAIKGGVGIEQAIEHGDLTAGLTAAAAAAGGIAGATGSPAVQDIADMAKDATQIARGIQTGDFGGILAGAGDLAGLDPQTRQLIQGGAGTLQSFARGDAAGGLAGLSNVLGGFNDPTAQELSTLALQGSRFTQALQTGDLGAVLGNVEGLARQLGAGGVVDQLQNAFAPLARMGLTEQNAATAIDLVKALGKGDLGAAAGDAQGLVQRLGGGDVVDKLKNEVLAPFQNLGVNGKDAQAVLDFAKSVANGDVGGALQTIGAEAGRLTNNPELQKAVGFVQDGAALAGALQQGRFSDALQRLGVPAGQVDTVRQAEGLFRALQNGDLAALAKTGPAQQLLQSAQSLAQKLGGGQALDAINRFSGALQQLRTATLPGFDQALVQQANQLLAQAQQLAGQRG